MANGNGLLSIKLSKEQWERMSPAEKEEHTFYCLCYLVGEAQKNKLTERPCGTLNNAPNECPSACDKPVCELPNAKPAMVAALCICSRASSSLPSAYARGK